MEMIRYGRTDFITGYNWTKTGRIKKELTPGEIEKLYPEIKNPESFSNGIIDAIINDDFRFKLTE